MPSQKELSVLTYICRDPLSISIRAFVPPPNKANIQKRRSSKPKQGPSEYTLVFDTETTVDERQALRVGMWQFYKGAKIVSMGAFFNAQELTEGDQRTLIAWARQRSIPVIPKEAFVDDVFYSQAYELRAAVVGFNLPFDISRLAIRHGPARKAMHGGFTFQLSADRWKPRVQIKHLSARAAFMQFTKPARRFDTRSMRRERLSSKPRRGSFYDVKTIAAALTSRSFSLGKLADFLETKHRKHSTDEHGGCLTREYLDYALNDVQVTWECFVALRTKFESHALAQTGLSQIISEAGLGKAYLKEMNIKPWRDVQPDFPDDLTGVIVSTYSGGRSEVHLRRVATQVLYCDFLSMYPTVCTLMGLWAFVIAKGMTWRDSTHEIRAYLQGVTLDDMQRPESWRGLVTIVQIQPDDDVFPIRAKYAGEPQATIGVNYAASNTPLWFTLADCISAKVLTGKAASVIRAISFAAGEPQDDLKPVPIAGNPKYLIDPNEEDFFRRLIDLRTEIKTQLKNTSGPDAGRLDSEQQSLKIIANATSYGIFVELNVEELDPPEQRMCFGSSGEPFPVFTAKGEQPGRYFHPLIATLITGAARLMLAISETLAASTGVDWAMCDTDSMALAKPDSMGGDEFVLRARAVCEWFAPLNPYAKKGPLFKIEDTDYEIREGKLTDKLEPLFCFAISAKRYVLFNRTRDGNIKIRKASAHGLGHVLPPYDDHEAPAEIPMPCVDLQTIGVERWQYDLWYQIVRAAFERHPDQVDLGHHQALNGPAASRYAATTPDLLRWFKAYNQNRPYRDQVRPFNFMLAFQLSLVTLHTTDVLEVYDPTKKGPKKRKVTPKPIAPYDKNALRAAVNCFDRETGRLVGPALLKTYRQALAQYHLSPESKFLNGEHSYAGPTRRRHVEVIAVHHIGKEANRWEEQYHLGLDLDAQIEYGMAPGGTTRLRELIGGGIGQLSERELAIRTGISRTTLSKLLRGESVRNAHVVAGKVLNAVQMWLADQNRPESNCGNMICGGRSLRRR